MQKGNLQMARVPHKHLENNNIYVSSDVDDKWQSVLKHEKFISDWDDNVIIIDTAHHQERNKKLKTLDLRLISLAVHGKKSIYSSNMMMSEFSNLCDLTKLSLNAALFRYERGKLSDAIGREFSLVQKLFVWMVRNGVYKFSELSTGDFKELGVELSRVGWWGVLDYDNAFRLLLEQAKSNPDLVDSLAGKGKAKWTSLNYEVLKNKIGLPFPATQIPMFFRDGISELLNTQRPNPNGTGFKIGNSPDSLIDSFSGINLLALHPKAFDSILFLPFPFASQIAKQLKHNSISNRTKTISLSDAICLFKEATRWVYILSPGILALSKSTRDLIEVISKEHRYDSANNEWSKSQKLNTIVRKSIEDNYRKLKPQYDFPYEYLSATKGGGSLKGLLYTLLTSLFILIAVNHGRRLNEIIGKDLPYGLYKGCMSNLGLEIPNYTIEIYIEKTVQNFSEFSCNQVVADCVNLLEKLYDLLCPFEKSLKISSDNITDKRKEKLFKIRSFSISGFLGDLENYDFSENSKEFFRLASVEQGAINNRAHPFRRLFALLYMNRFDHPELLALQNHLRHISPESTHIYVSPGNGELSNQAVREIESLASRENKEIELEINNVSAEYLKNKVLDILDGQLVGGYFPRLVSKLITRLNLDAEFSKKNLEGKSQKVTQTIINRGFRPLPMSSGVCMIGNSKHTRKIASCFENNKLNPSKASPETCSKCVNHLYPINALVLLDNEIEYQLSSSRDTRIPILIRNEHAKEANNLAKIRELEVNIANDNKDIFDNIAKSWGKSLKSSYE